MIDETTASITLRLEGARARRGVALSDLETFINSFISALREFDRDQRGASTRKSGHPEARAEAVVAFRLVGFREGSAIATIEPELDTDGVDTERMVDVEPVQVATLRSLLGSVEREESLPSSVTNALERAVRSAGDDGSLSVGFSGGDVDQEQPTVTIDRARIGRIRAAQVSPQPKLVSSVSGRLHQVDFEPDKLAIRSSDGVDWICSFPPELEPLVAALVNQLVWASGDGSLQSARRGSMRLSAVRPIEQRTQTLLFSAEPISDEAAQGIRAPQGLDVVGAASWSEADEVYLAALTDK